MKTSQLKFVNVIFLALLLFVAIGCQNRSEKAQLDKYKAAAQIQEQNKEIVREVINAIDSGDLDKLGNLLSDDFALYSPGSQHPWRKEALYQARNTHFAAFPDWIHKIEIMVAEGDKVAVKLTQYGTRKAKYKGLSQLVNMLQSQQHILLGLSMEKLTHFAANPNVNVAVQ